MVALKNTWETGEKVQAADLNAITTQINLNTQAIEDGGAGGDMVAAVYDPTGKQADAFNQDNMVSGANNKNYTTADRAKLTGIEPNADVTDAANVAAAGAAMKSDTSTTGMSFVIDEDNMASNTDTKVPTQQSVRAYVLAQIAALIGAAPAELDTWLELVAAIQNNQSALAGINTALTGKQPIDPTLTALAAVATAANKLVYADGSDSFATTDLTAFARTLLDDADALTARGTLGAQAANATLNALAALALANDNVLQVKAGALTQRTPAQLKADLVLDQVNNTADSAKAVLSATKLATPRTINGVPFDGTGNIAIPLPVWFEVHAAYGNRVTGYGDNTLGFLVPAAFTLTGVVFRGETADASGSTTVEIRKNGAQIASTAKTIAAANQWAYGANVIVSGLTEAIAAGDVLRPYISAVGTTPGKGFSAVLIGTTS
ncbi:hypothetical protein [Mycolicibacterium canariasense]|uniref:hypothetical protein n=1 Tax=Mycolicibacterium canariasense TaxID=228230 RepID=UPI000A146684|nr:hypothetical protein [Mycolicibacterium canariasense]MCV7208422.1 hypothetical protein [Mycolicibacterium canariasense]ORV10801.1 hypothetical protein AWB94_06540 [Mycolicibacterium canariasense]